MEKCALVLTRFHLETTHVTFPWLKQVTGHLPSEGPGNTILPCVARKVKNLGVWQASLPHPLGHGPCSYITVKEDNTTIG